MAFHSNKIAQGLFIIATLVSSSLPIAGCSTQNPIAAGETIPGTEITSCADDLSGMANPSGSISISSLKSSAASTVLEGKILWQASCPHDESDAETELVLDKMTFYRDDAGYPGDLIGEVDFDAHGVVSCADRDTTSIGGTTKSQPFGPQEVLDLNGLCVEYSEMPTGHPIYVQVEVTGHATTCSSTESSLLFLSRAGIECETP